MLSPCKDACDQHIKRDNYQIAIWRHCLEARPPVPSLHGSGCIFDRDMLVHWTDISACGCNANDCENRLVTSTDMGVDPLLSEDDSHME